MQIECSLLVAMATNTKMRQLKHGVPQGQFLDLLLSILFINDLHLALQYSSVHQFVEDTNRFVIENPLKQVTQKC